MVAGEALGFGKLDAWPEALVVMACTFVAFLALGRLTAWISFAVLPTYRALSERKKQSWNNIATSLVHSCIIAPLATHCMLSHGDDFFKVSHGAQGWGVFS